MTPVTLRKVPGTLVLGLLASLAAHAGLYGGTHVMGGPYHATLLQLAVVGALSLLAGFGFLAWSAANGAADGSILAARLRERLPGLAAVGPATALWFAAAEAIEPHHEAASPIATALALTVAAWLLARLARALVSVLAGAAIAVRRPSFSPRSPVWSRRARVLVFFRSAQWVRRFFARPPPIAIAARA